MTTLKPTLHRDTRHLSVSVWRLVALVEDRNHLHTSQVEYLWLKIFVVQCHRVIERQSEFSWFGILLFFFFLFPFYIEYIFWRIYFPSLPCASVWSALSLPVIRLRFCTAVLVVSELRGRVLDLAWNSFCFGYRPSLSELLAFPSFLSLTTAYHYTPLGLILFCYHSTSKSYYNSSGPVFMWIIQYCICWVKTLMKVLEEYH